MSLLIAAAAALWLAQTEEPATVIVDVTDQVTGQPVSAARVDAQHTSSGKVRQQRTDQFGLARFPQLEPGPYVFGVSRTGYLSADQGGRRFHLTLGSTGEARISISLQPTASISGRVLGEDNEPLEGVYVQVEQATGIPMSATSGKRGEYLIANLPPGDFRIQLQFPVAQIRRSLRSKGGEQWGYPNSLWHPGLEDKSNAAIVSLAPGLNLTGFDLRARRESLVKITGELIDLESRQPLTEAEVELRPEIGGVVDENFGRRPVASGSAAFHFPYTRPGRYSLMVYRRNSTSALPYVVPLDVGRAGLSGYRVSVPRFGRIVGQVDPAPPPRSEVALLGPSVGMGRQVSQVAPDGTFVFDDVPPGPLRFEGAFPGFYIKAMSFGGRSVARNAWLHDLLMPEALTEVLELTLSNSTGTIRGQVSDENGNPIPNHTVKLMPFRFGSTATDQNGAFTFNALPPGDYVLSACAKREEHLRVESGTQAFARLQACGP